MLILEDFEHAVRRRAPHIIAEVLGYVLVELLFANFQIFQRNLFGFVRFATRSDPSHLTSPSSTGDAAFRVMRAALTNAQLPASSVNYVCFLHMFRFASSLK